MILLVQFVVIEQASGLGIFAKHTFTLIGFDGDTVAYQQLAEMIRDNGGVLLTIITSVLTL